MKIAVLLTCYNRKNKTLQCLSNLNDQILSKGTSYDIYLVDDGSTDGTSEEVCSEYPLVHVIRGDGTLFWNRGMHLAWETAGTRNIYDAYIWINDDTFLFKDCIKRLVESSMFHNNQCIIIGACCWVNDKTKLSYGGYINNHRLKDANAEYKCDTMNGNIVLIPRFVYDKIGNLDYTFHHACGDLDYGYRATKNGIGIYQVKEFCGECNRHEKVDGCFDHNVTLSKRLHLFNYNHRFEDSFIAEMRHRGLFRAIIRSVTAFIHLFLPGLYDKIYGNKNI